MAQQATAENQVIEMMHYLGTCDLEDVTRRCPNLTWNQVFLAVDHLSRTSQVRLVPTKMGSYTVTLLPQPENRPDQHSLPS
jgi:hypothetical protein